MGRDKALLRFRGGVLGQYVAGAVKAAAGSAVLVGDPAIYHELGYTVIADRYPGAGPLGGILTALRHSTAEWNLVAACDMPGLESDLLRRILETAESTAADAVIPAGPEGRPEPLCAAYHRRSAEALERALAAGQRKIMAAARDIRIEILSVEELTPFQNVNTPEDWAGYGAE